jgi:hypothetical protein
MAIPGDLHDEIQRELGDACRRLARESDRLGRLIELERLALAVSLRLGRPVSVIELFEELGDEWTERLALLVRSLRDEPERSMDSGSDVSYR